MTGIENVHRIDQQAGAIMDQYHEIADRACLAGLLAMCVYARAACEEADTIRLDVSDQGSWMTPDYRLYDAQGTEVNEDWDDGGYASWLDVDRITAWAIVDGQKAPWIDSLETLKETNPHCEIDIQSVLDNVRIDQTATCTGCGRTIVQGEDCPAYGNGEEHA